MTAPVEEVDLPGFSSLRAVCARCACPVRAYVMFDRDCARARGDHYHRRCVVCGYEWLERCALPVARGVSVARGWLVGHARSVLPWSGRPGV